jgi:hypothetical protein
MSATIRPNFTISYCKNIVNLLGPKERNHMVNNYVLNFILF